MIYQRVALIGLGLIASSMAHAMRANGLAGEIVGTARSKASRDEALGKAYSAESELAKQVHAVAERIEAVSAKLAPAKPAK